MFIPGFDWRNPDYAAVFAERWRVLQDIRRDRALLPGLKRFYRDNPAQFITDWGCSSDPRNLDIGLPTVTPFILFPRQVEWVEWVLESWRARRPGVNPKSRESGISWLAIALSCTLCMFNDGMTIGFGSRKAELVDKLGDSKSLFWKAREFMSMLPEDFTGGWTLKNAPEMRIMFPATNSLMAGEGGDDIGRGARTTLYFVDESAYLSHPEAADSSLASTTNCRIDISTANGSGNPFHRKVTTWPAERVFRLHWRDDPRKDQAWYDKQKSELDPVSLAQEVDIDFAASVEGVVIPSAWVQASIDAHVKLGIEPTGRRQASFDVADEGKDRNAAGVSHGVLVEHIEEWTGVGDDIFGSVVRMFDICDRFDLEAFKYDSDGLGAGVRGDARVVNEQRIAAHRREIAVEAFRGSEAVFNPEGQDVRGRRNKDYFRNRKAQAWFGLRKRFQQTFRAVVEEQDVPADDIISLSSELPLLNKLMAELSQPTYSLDTLGKVLVDKSPPGTRSPNLADCVMILMSRAVRAPMLIDMGAVAAV